MVKQNPMINEGLKTSRYLCCQPFYHSLSFVVPLVAIRCHSLYHSLSLVVFRCHSLSFVVTRCLSLSLVVPLVVTRCHSLSRVVPLVVIRCHSLYHSLSLVVPLACLFINDLLKYVFMKRKKIKLVVIRIKKQVLHQ